MCGMEADVERVQLLRAIIHEADGKILGARSDEEVRDFSEKAHGQMAALLLRWRHEEKLSMKDLRTCLAQASAKQDGAVPLPPVPDLPKSVDDAVEASSAGGTPEPPRPKGTAFEWCFFPIGQDVASVLKAGFSTLCAWIVSCVVLASGGAQRLGRLQAPVQPDRTMEVQDPLQCLV